MSSSLTSLVPVLTGPHNYSEWASRMESYLGSQGQWSAMTRPRPVELIFVESMTWEEEITPAMDSKSAVTRTRTYSRLTHSDDPDKVEKREDLVEKWEDNDVKARGNIRLRLHHTIAYQHKDVATALELWDILKDKYGKPGPGIAYIELRKALSARLPTNSDLSGPLRAAN